MKRFDSAELTKRAQPVIARGVAEGAAAEPLDVNVIFTGTEATAAALKAAETFARELGAHIRLRAGVVVPIQLPLDQPLVSIEFFERTLRELLGRSEPDGLERTIHLYICRDWLDTISEVLKPDSVAVIGVRRRWWPTAESRLARLLRGKGIRVLRVPARKRAVGPLAHLNMHAWFPAQWTRGARPTAFSPDAREVK